MEDIRHNVFGTHSRSMSIDSGYSECRDRTSSAQSYCSSESDSSFAESKNDDDKDTNSSQQLRQCIPIRTREIKISDSLSKTPTPSKYYFMLQENENLIKSMKK